MLAKAHPDFCKSLNARLSRNWLKYILIKRKTQLKYYGALEKQPSSIRNVWKLKKLLCINSQFLRTTAFSFSLPAVHSLPAAVLLQGARAPHPEPRGLVPGDLLLVRAAPSDFRQLPISGALDAPSRLQAARYVVLIKNKQDVVVRLFSKSWKQFCLCTRSDEWACFNVFIAHSKKSCLRGQGRRLTCKAERRLCSHFWKFGGVERKHWTGLKLKWG